MNPESCSTKAQGCYAWVSSCIPSLSSTCSTKIVLIHAQSFLCMLKLIKGKKDSLAWCASTFQALALLMAVLLLWMQMFSYILSLPYVKCCPTLPPNGLYLVQQVSLGKTCISIEYPQYDWSRISGVIYYPCYVRLLLYWLPPHLGLLILLGFTCVAHCQYLPCLSPLHIGLYWKFIL